LSCGNAMHPKAEEGAASSATGFPMSGGGGGYYQAGGAAPAFAVVQAQAPVAAWSTGLFDCFDDVGNCKNEAHEGAGSFLICVSPI
jgi:hypothetical protein